MKTEIKHRVPVQMTLEFRKQLEAEARDQKRRNYGSKQDQILRSIWAVATHYMKPSPSLPDLPLTVLAVKYRQYVSMCIHHVFTNALTHTV